MTDPEPPPATWGACQFCGVAAPAGATKCPICGAENPVPAAEIATAQPRVRRRIRLTAAFRTLIVVAVAGALAYTLLAAVIAGPPVVADPLTTAGTYAIGPGNFTVISGNITGGDFVVGNYTALDPPGIDISVSVYNSSQWQWFTTGSGSPGAQWNNTPTFDGRIVFSAPYTDMYYFVFLNPQPPSSHLTVDLYVTTEYESNVGDDGFA
ncbi:MAG: emp24/gp25L/p24 family protein [Thermoplasmata archaeon]